MSVISNPAFDGAARHPAEYPIPAETAQAEVEIKKSRFIARAAHCPDRAQALALLEQARRDFPDARHHCWAYLLGPPHSPRSAAMSDDGEPGGTAGKPILNVLQHKGIGDIMLLVIRYFGGIKLGAGGLVRAYGQAAQAAIDQLPLTQRVPSLRLEASCDFSQEQAVRHWLETRAGTLEEVSYTHQVVLQVRLPAREQSAWEAFASALDIRSRPL